MEATKVHIRASFKSKLWLKMLKTRNKGESNNKKSTLNRTFQMFKGCILWVNERECTYETKVKDC